MNLESMLLSESAGHEMLHAAGPRRKCPGRHTAETQSRVVAPGQGQGGSKGGWMCDC